MKVNYECAPCMLRQSREAIEHAVCDEKKRMDVTLKVLHFLNSNFKEDTNSNKLGTDLHHLIMKETGNNDPYKELREDGNKLALGLLPLVEDILKKDDTLETYVKIAVVGNIIDFGALEEDTDMEKIIRDKLQDGLTINHTAYLDESLRKADKILYLSDNGGEIVFDKLLLKKVKDDYDLEIILALKENPILNDAIVSDGKNLKLDEYATLISTGSASVGVVKDYVSDDFKELLESVDLIISKGMGNYEGLTEMTINTPIFYLFNTKCNVIAKEIGVDISSNIIMCDSVD